MKAGTRLGAYEIVSPLGAGGMGEVFRARDTRLGRDVAIKIISQPFIADPERSARFGREAQLLAALNHPHIASVYGFEQTPAAQFLVMELVEGETLASRLRGGAIPVPEALRLAGQIADALQAAHEKGIIHRDLKPANIALTADGNVKVLDFGLAKALDPPEGPPGRPDATASPTLTLAATQAGVILGTAAYMSPEQARGKPADKRSDVWAFGVVVYEMLTGRRVFGQDETADTLAAVLTRDPDWTALPPSLPAGVATLVRGCLDRDRQRRIGDMAVIRYVLGQPVEAERRVARHPARWRLAAMAAAAAAAIAGTSGFLVGGGSVPALPAWSGGPIRMTLMPPAGTTFYNGDYGIPFAVSPDGRSIAFAATGADGGRSLWIRALDAAESLPVADTAGGTSPFWSADGEWLGFVAGSRLMRVPVSGGSAQEVAPLPPQFRIGGAWSRDDVIVFQPLSLSGLARVPAQGGVISTVTTIDRPERFHMSPHFLGDGLRFVYREANTGRVFAASIDGGAPQLVASLGGNSTLAYAPGFLLYVERGVIQARRFDEERLQLLGEPVRIADGVPVSGPGRAPFSVSSNGVLAYSSNAVGDVSVLQWFDRRGRAQQEAAPAANYSGFSLAPDGRRLAFSRWNDAGGRDVWLRDLDTSAESRLTSDGDGMMPVWSPRNGRLAVASGAVRPPDLQLLELDAGVRAESLVESGEVELPESWTPDGGSLVFTRQSPSGLDLWTMTIEGRQALALPISTSFNEWQGRVSPDGRWIAYVSNETGSEAVFIAEYPSGRRKRAVSDGAGTTPEWRADGRELFYVSDTKSLMAVPITPGAGLEAGKPVELFSIERPAHLEGRNDAVLYRADPGGQRFLIAVRAPAAAAPPIHVILNWTALVPRP